MVNFSLIIHPFIFSIYPILYIYSNNLHEIYLNEITPSIPYSLGLTIFVFFTFKFVFNEIHKAAFFTSLLVLIFFSYGHFFNILTSTKLNKTIVGEHNFLATLIFLVAFTIFYLSTKFKIQFIYFTKYLNIVSIVLLLTSLVTITNFIISNGINLKQNSDPQSSMTLSEQGIESKDLPDIYYLIFDEYGSNDVIKTVHNYDNSFFTESLEDKGFYIADESQTNYSLTFMSLASSLNMKYVNYLTEELGEKPANRDKVYNLIQDSKVLSKLKSKGYTIINIGTGWGPTDKNPFSDISISYQQRSEYTKILYNTTVLTILEKYQTDAAKSILFAFDNLNDIPKNKKPTFTFAHFLSPHPPYLFDRHGNEIPQPKKTLGSLIYSDPDNKWLEQLIFVNKKILDSVDQIISGSEKPPIIIIQGDHGTNFIGQRDSDEEKKDIFNTKVDQITTSQYNERMGILNAYYLPEEGANELYNTISPVNSFRIIFNSYFGENLKNLEDKYYFSKYKTYTKLYEVQKVDIGL